MKIHIIKTNPFPSHKTRHGQNAADLLHIPLCLALLLFCHSLLTSCGNAGQAGRKRFQTEFLDVFDTVSVLIGYDTSEEAFSEKAEAVHACLLEYHKLFDIYNGYEGITNLKNVNDKAGTAPVEVDSRILDLLSFGKEVYAETDGKVNIAYGAVLGIWHRYREDGINDPEHAALPSDAELLEAAKHTKIEDLVLDMEASTVYFQDPELRLDVGGIAKGYSVEKAGQLAASMGAMHFLLNVGGNLKAIGNRGDGTPWVCPVEDPFYRDSGEGDPYAATTGLNDLSLVTSGDYERYYMAGGQRYHHIIDPGTRFPATYHRSVTILARDSALADALSTGLFLMDAESGKALLQRINANLPENAQGEMQEDSQEDSRRNPPTRIEAMWIEADGSQIYSDGFREYLSR